MIKLNLQYFYSKESGIATIKDEISGITVHAILQQPGKKQAAVNAFLGARYSRSADSIVDIADEVNNLGIDAPKRLGEIFHGYGHASVGDLANLYVCIEQIPMITAMRFFNLNPVVSGQERSTRYQQFKIDSSTYFSAVEDPRFNNLMETQLKAYNELFGQTYIALQDYFRINESDVRERAVLKARTLDCTRFLLPMGVRTNVAALMSARAWSQYIGLCKGSNQTVEQIIGELLYQLLTGTPELEALGYVPEADELIRHTSPNDSADKTTAALKDFILHHIDIDLGLAERKRLSVRSYEDPVEALLRHVWLLNYPKHDCSQKVMWDFLAQHAESLGEIVFKTHNHHKSLGPIAQTGAISFNGYTDLGSLKDLNRHRSMERFIPILDNNFNIRSERCTEVELPLYFEIPQLQELRDTYQRTLRIHGYGIANRIRDSDMKDEEALEQGRYLMTHAHQVDYCLYGSPEDIQYVSQLRVRPGGHVNYRALVNNWIHELATDGPRFWLPLAKKMSVDPTSREQFLDRS